MTQSEIIRFIENNKEMLSRVLASGDTEAQSYALAMLALDPDRETIDEIEAHLDKLKR